MRLNTLLEQAQEVHINSSLYSKYFKANQSMHTLFKHPKKHTLGSLSVDSNQSGFIPLTFSAA